MDIFSIENEVHFEKMALEIFRFQAFANETYSGYLRLLGKNPQTIEHSGQIPFLPISFFKSHKVLSDQSFPYLWFESSGTTSSRSRHYLKDPELYKKSLTEGFKRVYGNPSDYAFLALLPTYLENPHSSLIYMVNELMSQSGNRFNGYFTDDLNDLQMRIEQCKAAGQKFFLWGVTYALLRLAEQYNSGLGRDAIVLETGGMKGHGKEMIREELHSILSAGLKVQSIQSEYGMTELLSQAYCTDGKTFHTPPWMKIKIRDVYDPFTSVPDGQTGAINVIDLANLHSCSFIATDDLGKIAGTGFEVLGRLDNSDIRGCNLLAL